MRNTYITLFGGRSSELDSNQAGINKYNLRKTNLSPHVDKVSIKKLEGEKIVPLFERRWFEIVPLDRTRPNAFSKSPHGEIVLPEDINLLKRHNYYYIREGEPLILNNVLSKVLNDPEEWSKLLLANFLLKKKSQFRF
jgi:hypothetical protein